jgi:YgiT-type zinc finger domain-containing protein
MEDALQEQEGMKCIACNLAETISGTTSILLERDQLHLTIKHVPAQICPGCGEMYADETVAVALLHQAEKIARAGAKVDVCDYAAAMD